MEENIIVTNRYCLWTPKSCTTAHLPAQRREKKGRKQSVDWRTTWSHGNMPGHRSTDRSRLHSGNKLPKRHLLVVQPTDMMKHELKHGYLQRRHYDVAVLVSFWPIYCSQTTAKMLCVVFSHMNSAYVCLLVTVTFIDFCHPDAAETHRAGCHTSIERKMYYPALRIFSQSLVWTHH